MTAAAYLCAGVGSPAGVQAYAGRTLDLLHAIEKTIDLVSENGEHVRVLARGIGKCLAALKDGSIEVKLDPEGRVCDLFARGLESLQRMHRDASLRRDSAAADQRLQDDDGVVEVYDSFLEALSDAYDVLHELREWIETHDALLEPAVGEVHTDADDLVSSILSRNS